MAGRMCQSARSSKDASRNRRDCGRSLTRTLPPVPALPGLGTLPGAAGRTPRMEISQEGGVVVVPGVRSLVPSLFPDSRQYLQPVPYVLCPRRWRYERIFCIPFLQPGTMGTMGTQSQWKVLRSDCRGTAVERPGTNIRGVVVPESWSWMWNEGRCRRKLRHCPWLRLSKAGCLPAIAAETALQASGADPLYPALRIPTRIP